MNSKHTSEWIKASASDGNGSCVQLRRNGEHIEMRDSKHGEASPILQFTHNEVAAFLDGARKAEFDGLLD